MKDLIIERITKYSTLPVLLVDSDTPIEWVEDHEHDLILRITRTYKKVKITDARGKKEGVEWRI